MTPHTWAAPTSMILNISGWKLREYPIWSTDNHTYQSSFRRPFHASTHIQPKQGSPQTGWGHASRWEYRRLGRRPRFLFDVNQGKHRGTKLRVKGLVGLTVTPVRRRGQPVVLARSTNEDQFLHILRKTFVLVDILLSNSRQTHVHSLLCLVLTWLFGAATTILIFLV